MVIDFTSHDASARNAELCADKGVALVIGSTGFTAEAKAKLEFVFLDRIEDAIRTAIGELPVEKKAA